MTAPRTTIGATLEMLAAQIEAALAASALQVEILSSAVAGIATDTSNTTTVTARRVRQALVAMQFHDQLSQRLSHVSHALRDLAPISGITVDSEDWEQILRGLRERLSLEEERALFDSRLDVAPSSPALPDVDPLRISGIELF